MKLDRPALALRRSRSARRLFVPGVLSLAIAQAWAQESPPPAPVGALDAVTITGQGLSIKRSITAKRLEGVMSDVISADDVGSIPDFGLGEALERIPGVSMIVNNARGEAQFMTLRGFNPDYNTVMIDGVALPSSETTRRTVSLDVIPSSLARQVSVYKTFTPEMEGNAIGGITNLRTRSALDQTGTHFSGRADLSHWTNEPRIRGNSPSGTFELTGSSTFGARDQFGLLLSANYFRRVSSSLNTAIDSYSYYANAGTQTNAARLTPSTTSVDGAIAMPDRLRWLSYDNVRTRKGLFGKFDFDDGGAFRGHVSAGAFQHLNDEDRRAHWLQNTTTGTSSITVNEGSGSVASGQSQSDYAKYDQDRKLRYVEAGGEFKPWTGGVIELLGSTAKGSYRQDAKLYTFATGNSTALAYDYRYTPGEAPVFTPLNSAALFDAGRYNQTENTTQVERSENKLDTLRLSLAHNLGEDDRGWGYKSGVQRRALTQRYDFDETRFNPASGQTITLAQVGVGPSDVVPYNSEGRALLLPDPAAAQAYLEANPTRYATASTNTQNSTQRDFSIDENIDAGYAMAAYRAKAWAATFGVRGERTNTTVDAYVATPANQTVNYAATTQSSRRTDWLPSLNLHWDLDPALRLRAAASKSLARPTYANLGQNSSSVSGTTITQTLGNPSLLPRQSRNLDLSAEWNPTRDSLLAAALFRKSISDEIASLTSTSAAVIGSTSYTQNVTQAQNVGKAAVTGLEVGLADVRFDFLPAPFNQFGATANFTLLDDQPASVRMANGSDREMPSLMEAATRMGNLALLWGTGPWSAKLAYNHTGKTLQTLSTSNAALDVYYAARNTVDAQFGYRVGRGIGVLVQAKNLTGERIRRITGPNASLLNQELDNGRAFYLSATYAY